MSTHSVAEWFGLVGRDVRYAVRSLRATPVFTIVALAVLTLSIGATTAIFSVVDAVVLRGLPFADSNRLVAVGQLPTVGSESPALNLAAPQNFLEWRAEQDVFVALAAVAYSEISLRRQGDALPENLRAQRVTADFFTVLQSPPLLGRGFSPEDEIEGRGNVAVISHALWQRRFGGSRDVLGAQLAGQTRSFEVIGVMPPGFSYPIDSYVLAADEPAELWVPYVFGGAERVRGKTLSYHLHVVGRLRDDVSIAQAQARMEQIGANAAAKAPGSPADRLTRVEPLHELVTRSVRRWMIMLLAVVSCVLLIACVNLANLMLMRASTRVRELGVRAALGASSRDLARGLLVESVVLSLTGAALGTLVAWWGVAVLASAIPAEVPRAAEIAVDLRVLAVALVAAILTGVGFGLAPVAKFSRPTVASAFNHAERMNTAGSRTKALRATLVVAEVALAVVLVVGSGLFLASFVRIMNIDLGMDLQNVLTVRVRTLDRPTDFRKAADRNRQLLLNVTERVRRIPGVEVVSMVGAGLPLRGDARTTSFAIPGRQLPDGTAVVFNQITPDYFRSIKVPLLKGRFFADADHQNSQPVVILDQTAAARYFGGDDPIGRVVNVGGDRTVVGVVGNIREEGPEDVWRTHAFVPVAQSQVFGGTLVIRTAEGSRGILSAVRQAIWSEFPDGLPVRIDERGLAYYFDALVAQRRFNMMLLAIFGVLGLTIACVGIYGVMAYSVSQRTQEIGIRKALGALPGTILRSVLGSALLTMAVGLSFGLLGAWALAGLVQGFLFEVRPHEPIVYLAAVLVLAATGMAAAFFPARRAAAVDPFVALRMD
jgi:predicted permease